MKIRDPQRDVLAAAAMDTARRDGVLALRDRGFDVEPDSSGRVFTVRDRAEGWARLESRGFVTRVTTAEGRITETEQYWNGRIRRIVDAAGGEVRFDRDDAGFLTAIDRGRDGGIYRFVLSPDWQPLRIDYPDGTTCLAEYSESGHPTRIVNRGGSEVRYEYRADGRVGALIDPKGYRTEVSYVDAVRDSRTITYPDGHRHEYVDEPRTGLLRHDVDGAPHAEYRYDRDTDSLEVAYATGDRERFVFNGGRIVGASNANASVKLNYDDAGRLMSEETNGRVVRYLRNEVGALVGIATPSGRTIRYVHDRDQRLTRIVDDAGASYDLSLEPVGPPTAIRYPNGVTVAIGTNAMGLTSQWNVSASGRDGSARELDAAHWRYDACDRVISERRAGEEREFRYDRASRLVAVNGSSGNTLERFRLDVNGNRLESDGEQCRYGPSNTLLQEGRRRFRYDPLGNLTEELGDVAATYGYNGRGQLVAARMDNRSVQYTYDALGRRLQKRSRDATTTYEWAGTQLLSETVDDGQSVVRRDYVICPQFLTPLAFSENGATYYIHCGRLQEPLCVTDQSAEIVWRASYRSFGRALISTASIRQPFRLPGQYHDEETGLHYALARYYDPDRGRFLSPDPMRRPGASLNYYTYCDGDPLNRVDPTGEISLTIGTVLGAIAIGIALGAAIGAGVELYRQRNQETTDWGQVGRAALIGGCLGGIAGGVGVVAAAAAAAALGVAATGMVAGAIGGGVAGGVVYCVEAAAKGEFDAGEFVESIVLGAAIGAVTAGVGGIIARRFRAKPVVEDPIPPKVPPEKPAAASSPQKGSVSDANFAQSKINAAEKFSPEGSAKYTKLAGRPIETVDDLAKAIRDGTIKPSDVPVDYVVGPDGTKLILNTRTSAALDRAGVPKTEWHGVDRTGQPVPGAEGTTFNDLADAQLKRNGLPPNGTPNTPQGKNK